MIIAVILASFAHDEGVSILIDEPAVEPAHREPAATVARRDVEAYLAMPVANQILLSTSYDPVTAWIHGTCVPSNAAKKSFSDGVSLKMGHTEKEQEVKLSFLSVNALRYLGGHAAAGKPERDFSFCGMVNSALRTKQKASSIERADYNKLNSHFGCSIGDIVKAYLERHPNTKKSAGGASSGRAK